MALRREQIQPVLRTTKSASHPRRKTTAEPAVQNGQSVAQERAALLAVLIDARRQIAQQQCIGGQIL